jgi:hypothetical protein
MRMYQDVSWCDAIVAILSSGQVMVPRAMLRCAQISIRPQFPRRYGRRMHEALRLAWFELLLLDVEIVVRSSAIVAER